MRGARRGQPTKPGEAGTESLSSAFPRIQIMDAMSDPMQQVCSAFGHISYEIEPLTLTIPVFPSIARALLEVLMTFMQEQMKHFEDRLKMELAPGPAFEDYRLQRQRQDSKCFAASKTTCTIKTDAHIVEEATAIAWVFHEAGATVGC